MKLCICEIRKYFDFKVKKMTPYEILGVSPGEKNLKVIKRAYHRLLRIHKPEQDPEGFQRIRSAYDSLKQMLEKISQEKQQNNLYVQIKDSETASEVVIENKDSHCELDMNALDNILKEWAQKNNKEQPQTQVQTSNPNTNSYQYSTTKIPSELEWYIEKLNSKSMETEKEAWIVEIAREFTQKVKSHPRLTSLWSDTIIEVFEKRLSLLNETIDDDDLWWELENGQYKLTETLIDTWWDYGNHHRLARFGRLWAKKMDNCSYPYAMDISTQLGYYLTLIASDVAAKLADKIFALSPENAHVHWSDQMEYFLILAQEICRWPVASRHYLSQIFLKGSWDAQDTRDIADKTYKLLGQLPSSSNLLEYLKENFSDLARHIESRQAIYRKKAAKHQAKRDSEQGTIIVFTTLIFALFFGFCSRMIDPKPQRTYVPPKVYTNKKLLPKIDIEKTIKDLQLQNNQKFLRDGLKEYKSPLKDYEDPLKNVHSDTIKMLEKYKLREKVIEIIKEEKSKGNKNSSKSQKKPK